MSLSRVEFRWMVLVWLGLATLGTFVAMAHALLEQTRWTMT
jgi:hypothetical protein